MLCMIDVASLFPIDITFNPPLSIGVAVFLAAILAGILDSSIGGGVMITAPVILAKYY